MAEEKRKPTLRNDSKRKAYVRDERNWEDVGELEELRTNDGRPVFKLKRLKGTGIYLLASCNPEWNPEIWVGDFDPRKPSGYRWGWMFELDQGGFYDPAKNPLSLTAIVQKLKELKL